VAPKLLSARWVLAASLALGLVLRLLIVFGGDEGIIWPDEVYQSFEPAHRLVFGYGFVAWEFIDGARNWALPGLVAFWLKLCALLGGDSPFVYVRVVKLVFALASVGAAWGVYRLAVVLGAQEVPAAAAAALWACCGVALLFGHRAMSENASALPVVWGLALVLERNGSRRRLVLGASLLGMATLLRLQAGVFCVGAVAILLGRALAPAVLARAAVVLGRGAGGASWRARAAARLAEAAAAKAQSGAAQAAAPVSKAKLAGAQPMGPWRRVAAVLAVLLLWAVAFGALDAATWKDAPNAKWGGWFHSAVVYLRFNLIEGRASNWGTSPWSYYFQALWDSMPGVTAALALGGVLSLRRAPGVALLVMAFIGLHMAVGHKELRFILPVLPVACALVAVALSSRSVEWSWLSASLVLVAAVWSGLRADTLTMGQIGSYGDRPTSSAWDDFGNVNRLLLVASRQKDLCGLRIDVAHMAWTGGFTYLHTRAPIFPAAMPHQHGHFNYLITFPGSGAEVVAQDKGIELVRLPGVTACVPFPEYSWRLP
jgi:hypothetical protein